MMTFSKCSEPAATPRLGTPPCSDLAEFLERLKANPRTVNLPLPPLMHGTGLLSAVGAMAAGGTCITLTSQSFEPKLALENITKHKVTQVTIVGDAFARPMLEVLDENPEEYDISSVSVINSSGVMWTREIKAGLLKHNENLLLSDAFSSSEAIGIGTSLMTKDQTIDVAKFALGPNCKVFSEDLIGSQTRHRRIRHGCCRRLSSCRLLQRPEKTDKTFKIIDGVRYSIPGDWVRVEDDGSLTLLGRGSNCINTAGEKVYPEEVEEALKFHDAVADALVVGVKDAKWGQSITAVVQPNEGCVIDELELKEFSRKHLAAYKLPKKILVKGNLNRAPNGKADYKSIQEYAERQLGINQSMRLQYVRQSNPFGDRRNSMNVQKSNVDA